MNTYASIYIPRMSTIHTEDSIKEIMSAHSIGTVCRVDFTQINKKPGFSESVDDRVMSAFVHFSDPIIVEGDGCYNSDGSWNSIGRDASWNSITLWNSICFNVPYRLQITPNEYWICLKNKNPIQRTMMNIHQVVENGRHLENLVEEQRIMIGEQRIMLEEQRIMLENQQTQIAELTKTSKRVDEFLYQLVGGMFNQKTQAGILRYHLSMLGHGDGNRGCPDKSESIWPTTRQGDDCEARIEKIERIICNSSLTMSNDSTFSHILDDAEKDCCSPCCMDDYAYERLY